MTSDDVWKILTLLVAGDVAFIGYLKFYLAREKLKLDLFEKRFSVFAPRAACFRLRLPKVRSPWRTFRSIEPI